MNTVTMCDKKYQVTTIVQEIFDEYNRLQEVYTQFKCENDLKLRNDITTIRRQEEEIKERDLNINTLETNLSKKTKQIDEYEKMIIELEDKIHQIMHEKEEEGRFDILRVQANTIHEKEQEIERLNTLIYKGKSKLNKNNEIKNVLDMINTVENNVEISVQELNEELKPDTEVIEYGECAADIAADRMAAGFAAIKEENLNDVYQSDDKDNTEDDYEILTYRKKEYWIKVGEDPQYVYEVLDDDCLGDKLGVYEKGNNGKMKVVLDKK